MNLWSYYNIIRQIPPQKIQRREGILENGDAYNFYKIRLSRERTRCGKIQDGFTVYGRIKNKKCGESRIF
jgi:hypothetical protein